MKKLFLLSSVLLSTLVFGSNIFLGIAFSCKNSMHIGTVMKRSVFLIFFLAVPSFKWWMVMLLLERMRCGPRSYQYEELMYWQIVVYLEGYQRYVYPKEIA